MTLFVIATRLVNGIPRFLDPQRSKANIWNIQDIFRKYIACIFKIRLKSTLNITKFNSDYEKYQITF